MFGYLRPLVAELKVGDYQRYQASYCGLCRALGRQSGQTARLAIQYDIAGLAMVLSDLAGEPEQMRMRRCVARPFRRHKVRETTSVYRYCADMTLLLVHRRASDDWEDERVAKALLARAGLGVAARHAARRVGQAARQMDERLAALHRLEQDSCRQMDLPAEEFGRMMEELALACPGMPEAVRPSLGWMVRQLGRWLYLVDALDDLENDRRHGSYNPILAAGGRPEDRALAAEACRWAAGQALSAMDLLPLTTSQPVLENILCAGMPAQLTRALAKGNDHGKSL